VAYFQKIFANKRPIMKFLILLTILVAILCLQVHGKQAAGENARIQNDQRISNGKNPNNRNLAQGQDQARPSKSRDGSPSRPSKPSKGKKAPAASETEEKVGNYKVGTDEDWQAYELEFEADDLFQLLISKRRSINFNQEV
jgi:hypothetical protein